MSLIDSLMLSNITMVNKAEQCQLDSMTRGPLWISTGPSPVFFSIAGFQAIC